MAKNYETWSDIYNALLDQGYDYGFAAYRADEWDKARIRRMELVRLELTEEEAKALLVLANEGAEGIFADDQQVKAMLDGTTKFATSALEKLYQVVYSSKSGK